jgi:hypothetical protein
MGRVRVYCPPPGMQTEFIQLKPLAQSVFAAQGKAQRPVCVLHLCVPQIRSLWQGRARGLGAGPVLLGGALG